MRDGKNGWESSWVAALAAATMVIIWPPGDVAAQKGVVTRLEVPPAALALAYLQESRLAARAMRAEQGAKERLPSLEQVEERCPGGLEVLEEVRSTYGLPQGPLFSVWWKENRNRCSESAGQTTAAMLSKKGSACWKERAGRGDGDAFCAQQWEALKAVCAQVRADGSLVCDPETVLVGSSFEMGDLQFLPTKIMRPVAGEHVRTEEATDHDRDGVVDPLDIGDALATAAIMLRRKAEGYCRGVARCVSAAKSWVFAMYAYNGSWSYVTGTPLRWGAVDIWSWYLRERQRRGE